jgi:hypothetical protein
MYIYFGTDNLIILGLFVLASAVALLLGVCVFALSVKILLVLKYIKEYIKRRGDK